MMIAGIEIERVFNAKSWDVKSLEWTCHVYRVASSPPVTRKQLSGMIGREVGGGIIVGIESFAVQAQEGKKIGLCFKSTDKRA